MGSSTTGLSPTSVTASDVRRWVESGCASQPLCDLPPNQATKFFWLGVSFSKTCEEVASVFNACHGPLRQHCLLDRLALNILSHLPSSICDALLELAFAQNFDDISGEDSAEGSVQPPAFPPVLILTWLKNSAAKDTLAVHTVLQSAIRVRPTLCMDLVASAFGARMPLGASESEPSAALQAPPPGNGCAVSTSSASRECDTLEYHPLLDPTTRALVAALDFARSLPWWLEVAAAACRGDVTRLQTAIAHGASVCRRGVAEDGECQCEGNCDVKRVCTGALLFLTAPGPRVSARASIAQEYLPPHLRPTSGFDWTGRPFRRGYLSPPAGSPPSYIPPEAAVNVEVVVSLVRMGQLDPTVALDKFEGLIVPTFTVPFLVYRALSMALCVISDTSPRGLNAMPPYQSREILTACRALDVEWVEALLRRPPHPAPRTSGAELYAFVINSCRFGKFPQRHFPQGAEVAKEGVLRALLEAGIPADARVSLEGKVSSSAWAVHREEGDGDAKDGVMRASVVLYAAHLGDFKSATLLRASDAPVGRSATDVDQCLCRQVSWRDMMLCEHAVSHLNEILGDFSFGFHRSQALSRMLAKGSQTASQVVRILITHDAVPSSLVMKALGSKAEYFIPSDYELVDSMWSRGDGEGLRVWVVDDEGKYAVVRILTAAYTQVKRPSGGCEGAAALLMGVEALVVGSLSGCTALVQAVSAAKKKAVSPL